MFRIRDPEKKSSRIPEPWGKKALDPGSGSATLVHWNLQQIPIGQSKIIFSSVAVKSSNKYIFK
jgi:hypothetical protein